MPEKCCPSSFSSKTLRA